MGAAGHPRADAVPAVVPASGPSPGGEPGPGATVGRRRGRRRDGLRALAYGMFMFVWFRVQLGWMKSRRGIRERHELG